MPRIRSATLLGIVDVIELKRFEIEFSQDFVLSCSHFDEILLFLFDHV